MLNWAMEASKDGLFQSRKQDYFNWKIELQLSVNSRYHWGFSPASRIILIERSEDGYDTGEGNLGFSPASRIILIESQIQSTIKTEIISS